MLPRLPGWSDLRPPRAVPTGEMLLWRSKYNQQDLVNPSGGSADTEKLERELAILSSKKKEQDQQLLLLQNEIGKLEGEKEEQDRQRQQLNNEIGLKQEELDKQRTLAAEKQKLYETSKKATENLQAAVKKLSADYTSAKETFDKTTGNQQTMIVNLKKQETVLRAQVEAAAAEANKLKTGVQRLEAQATKSEGLMAALLEKIESKENETTELETELENVRMKHTVMLKKLREDRKLAKATFNETTTTQKAEIAKLEEQIDSSEKEKANLKTLVEAEEAKAKKLEAEVQRLEKVKGEKEEKDRQLVQLQEKLQAQATAFAAQVDENKALQQRLVVPLVSAFVAEVTQKLEDYGYEWTDEMEDTAEELLGVQIQGGDQGKYGSYVTTFTLSIIKEANKWLVEQEEKLKKLQTEAVTPEDEEDVREDKLKLNVTKSKLPALILRLEEFAGPVVKELNQWSRSGEEADSGTSYDELNLKTTVDLEKLTPEQYLALLERQIAAWDSYDPLKVPPDAQGPSGPDAGNDN